MRSRSTGRAVALQLREGVKANAPIKLQLDPTDMAKFNIKQLSFTPAHFNTGEGQEEFISTSTGEYVVTWNFTAIKAGQRFHYKSGTTTNR